MDCFWFCQRAADLFRMRHDNARVRMTLPVRLEQSLWPNAHMHLRHAPTLNAAPNCTAGACMQRM